MSHWRMCGLKWWGEIQMKWNVNVSAAVMAAGLGLGGMFSPAQAATTCAQVGVTAIGGACADGKGGIYNVNNSFGNDFPGEVEEKISVDGNNTLNNHNTGTVDGHAGVVVHFKTDDNVTAASGAAQIGNGNTESFNVLDVSFTLGANTLLFGDLGFDTHFIGDVDDIKIQAFRGLSVTPIIEFATSSLSSFVSANGEVGWMVLALGDELFDRIHIESFGLGDVKQGIQLSGFNSTKHYEVSRLGALIPDTQCTVNCVNTVPLPAGIWLFGSALAGLGALKVRRRRRAPAAA